MSIRTVKVWLAGSVQGCGVRPALARLAAQQGWWGFVRNTSDGVELVIEGDLDDDPLLGHRIRGALPERATMTQLTLESCAPLHATRFSIEPSAASVVRFGAAIPRDAAICQVCLAEVRDVTNRRYAYPFTSCAECGPRYSILTGMPFDRERTTMHEFDLCDRCRQEYLNPSDRRFHAQTICCPECGPHIWSTDGNGKQRQTQDAALRDVADHLMSGGIACVRGVGGYQLFADATSDTAVRKLRDRKARPAKPLAVLCRDLEEARMLAVIDDLEAQQLISPQNPIVLVQQRRNGGLAAQVNPGLNDVGILLPTTALHDRLAELAQRPLVCTSGNREGEPLSYQVAEAQERLGDIADVFLHHNRDIARPIDDSVVRVMADRAVTIRCARGLAPLPLRLTTPFEQLALGGHQKSAVALSSGGQALLGPHLGDLETVASRERWCHQTQELLALAGTKHSDDPLQSDLPECMLNCWTLDGAIQDCHPEYFSSRVSESTRVPKVEVWHHHAHIAAGMLEHQWLDRTVVGIAFDGTGLGPDGSIWGGELLIASAKQASRAGHLRPFGLPGGEAAVRDLRRTTVSLLAQLEELSLEEIANLVGQDSDDVARLIRLLSSHRCIQTSSCGRLFDAFACLILQHHHAAFEGQGAMCLEAACDTSDLGVYQFDVIDVSPLQLDWHQVLRQVVSDLRRGVSPMAMAMRFHRGLAVAIVDICGRWPDLPVVLGGGVFQNRILVELLAATWPTDRAPLGLPGLIPPNDGGLAAGQLVVATALTKQRSR